MTPIEISRDDQYQRTVEAFETATVTSKMGTLVKIAGSPEGGKLFITPKGDSQITVCTTPPTHVLPQDDDEFSLKVPLGLIVVIDDFTLKGT